MTMMRTEESGGQVEQNEPTATAQPDGNTASDARSPGGGGQAPAQNPLDRVIETMSLAEFQDVRASLRWVDSEEAVSALVRSIVEDPRGQRFAEAIIQNRGYDIGTENYWKLFSVIRDRMA